MSASVKIDVTSNSFFEIISIRLIFFCLTTIYLKKIVWSGNQSKCLVKYSYWQISMNIKFSNNFVCQLFFKNKLDFYKVRVVGGNYLPLTPLSMLMVVELIFKCCFI
jgi:hypothetical protein